MADAGGYSSPAMTAEADAGGDSSPAKPGLVKSEDEMYMESLVGVSLLLVCEESPLEVQLHGSKMLHHLLDRRSGQLSAAQLLNLKIRLVESSTSSSPIFLSTVKRAPGFEDERLGFSLVLDPCFISSSKSSSSYPPIPCKSLVGQPPSVSEDETIQDNGGMIFHQRNDRLLLLAEHNLLCEAFRIATSLLGTVQCARIIPCLLDALDRIWSLVEWKYYVSDAGQLFSDGQFLEMAYPVVKFIEEQLKRSRTHESGGACDLFLVDLLRQILPLLLRLLERIHALWVLEDLMLPEEIERAKSLSCVELATMLQSTNGLYDIDNDEYLRKNKTWALLEGTRQRVYNVLGLCTSIEGVFSELLDSLSVQDFLLKDIGPMELRHLVKVIRLIAIPLVKNCPFKFLESWTIDFLGPILAECEYRLHYAWFDLLHQGGTGKPYFYGKLVGSDRQIKELKQKVLLEFTREVSDLLRVLALAEQNMESVSCSLLSFLFRHDCFERMRMSLFGYFVDDETTIKAVPFCRSLTRLAIDDMSVRHSIVSDLLPCLIRRLDNQLPCAIQRLRRKLGLSTKSSASKDLEALCEEWYNHFEKNSAGEGLYDACAENNFAAWLTKKKEELRVKARSAAKELRDGSDWNWEFEDEFRRYLPVYMDILQQVDSIDDYDDPVFSEEEWLFQKLKPEFRSKYGMNSCEHHYMLTIFSLWQGKDSMACTMVKRNQGKFVCELLKLKPYIKASDSSSVIVDRLKENSEIQAGLPDFAVNQSVSYLRGLLFRWEPVFHPLIRESHMDLLLRVVDQYTKWNESKHCQPLGPDTSDFESHLQPYARTYFETRLKEKKYHIATEQVCLHKKFDSYLSSGVLDIHMDVFRSSKDDFVKNLVQNEMARMQLSDLNNELIKLSLERRHDLVRIQYQVIKYSECLRGIFNNESLKDQLGVLMMELEIKGFFNTDNDSVEWENKLFSEHVDRFNNLVFARHRLPKHYVVRGIIDYRSILMCNDISWQAAFEAVVDEKCDRWIGSREEFWMKTSYYEHLYYNIVRRPLEQQIINERDEKLVGLKEQLGEEVYQALTTALLEINEHNASGSYSYSYVVSELWNNKENKKASMGEVMEHIRKQWKLQKRKGP